MIRSCMIRRRLYIDIRNVLHTCADSYMFPLKSFLIDQPCMLFGMPTAPHARLGSLAYDVLCRPHKEASLLRCRLVTLDANDKWLLPGRSGEGYCAQEKQMALSLFASC
jgi:hypothetical protein